VVGYVCGDGDGVFVARLGDDRCFLFVVFGVQYFVGDVALVQLLGEVFVFFDVCGVD